MTCKKCSKDSTTQFLLTWLLAITDAKLSSRVFFDSLPFSMNRKSVSFSGISSETTAVYEFAIHPAVSFSSSDLWGKYLWKFSQEFSWGHAISSTDSFLPISRLGKMEKFYFAFLCRIRIFIRRVSILSWASITFDLSAWRLPFRTWACWRYLKDIPNDTSDQGPS